MTAKNFRLKAPAMAFARKRRAMGFNVSMFKKKKGFGVSSTR